jgi:glycosyltransferase involved in cell wall biosynthesis
VTFDVGGLSDWLVDGGTGLFAKSPDGATRVAAARTPAAFASALDAAASPDRLAEMSANALDIVDRLFNPDSFMKELLQWQTAEK